MNLPRSGRQAARRVGDVVGVALDAADQLAHGLGHVIEASSHVTQLVPRGQLDVRSEIAGGEPLAAVAQAANAGHHRQVGAHREIADHCQYHQQHGEVAEQHLPRVVDALLQQLVQARQQHVVHLRVADADRFGGHVEELRRRGAAEIATHHHALHHPVDRFAALTQGRHRAVELRLQLRSLGDDLFHAAFHLHRGRTDLLGHDDQRRALLIADFAPGEHGRRTAAQTAQAFDEKRQAVDRGGHEVIGLRLRIESQAVSIGEQRLEIQQLADQCGMRLIALRLRPTLHAALDLVPAAADVLPFAHGALVIGQGAVHFRDGRIDAGLQGGSAIGHGHIAAQQHRRYAAMLLGQLDELGQRPRQGGRHQLVLGTLDGAVELTGDGPHQAGEGEKHQQADQSELARIVETVHQQFSWGKQEFHRAFLNDARCCRGRSTSWRPDAGRRLARDQIDMRCAAQNTDPTRRSP